MNYTDISFIYISLSYKLWNLCLQVAASQKQRGQRCVYHPVTGGTYRVRVPCRQCKTILTHFVSCRTWPITNKLPRQWRIVIIGAVSRQYFVCSESNAVRSIRNKNSWLMDKIFQSMIFHLLLMDILSDIWTVRGIINSRTTHL